MRRWRLGPRGAVLAMAVLYAFAFMDRMVISMVIGPIQEDLGFGDFQAGLLVGTAFAITYVLLGTPFGWAADRYPRRYLVVFGLAVWTVGTLGSGFAMGFATLFILRMLVGFGEAALSPVAYSLISDLFPHEKRGFALSAYQTGSSVGGGLAALAGGLIVDAAVQAGPATSIFGGPLYSWQMVFLIVGAPGLLLIALAFALPEPRKEGRPPPQLRSSEIRHYVKRNFVLLALLFVTYGMVAMVGHGVTFWTPEFMVRKFGWSRTEIGSLIGPIYMIVPVISYLTTGWLMDRVFRSGVKDAPLRVFLVMSVATLPFSVYGFLTDNVWIFIFCLTAVKMLFVPTVIFGATAIQSFTPEALRGRVSGAFLSFLSLVGYTLGPGLVGWLSQFQFGGTNDLGLPIAWMNAACVSLVSLLLLLSLAPLRRAVVEEERRLSGLAPVRSE